MEAGIGSTNESEESYSPKLSLLSRSRMWEWEWEFPEAQGSKTPPIIAPLSIPFKWEEAPGKPKPRDIPCGLSASRSLHLPPRLLLHDHGSPPFVDAHAPTKLPALRSRSYSSRVAVAVDLLSHPQQWRKLDSPTSILNSPSSTSSRGSSVDEVARLHKQNLRCGSGTHKMRRLLDHWTPSLRWPKVKEECASPSSSSSDDCHKSHRPSSIAPARNKWVLRKMKRSSRVFGTILKRMRSRMSLEEGR